MAKLSLALASIHPSATPIWPLTGYALGIVLLLGFGMSAAIFAGAFIANATTAGSIDTSLLIAMGNTLESLVGAWLINRWSDGLRTFDTPGGVARFALICFAPSTVLSATIGVGSLALAGYAPWPDFAAIWMTWWMGDLAGALVITPVMVLWGTQLREARVRREIVRASLPYGLAILVGLVAFSPLLAPGPARTPLAFLAVLPLMWAALRRDQRDTAATALLLSSFAVWGTVSQTGAFVRSNLNESFLLLLAFVISVSVPSLILSADVAVRRRHDEHMRFVMRELSHRSKNLLAVVQSIAHHIARDADSLATFLPAFSDRLHSFAATHDLLVAQDWRGTAVEDLVRTHMAPFQGSAGAAIAAGGPPLTLQPKAAEYIGLALHELATNAVKHGALSVPSGAVTIRWTLDAEHLHISWQETGGPRVDQPQRRGFGELILGKVVPASLDGTASIRFTPEGIEWRLAAPCDRVLAEPACQARVEPRFSPPRRQGADGGPHG